MTRICERNAKRVEGTNFREYHTGKFYRISLSGASHLEYINPELCAMLGYERKEIEDLFQNRYTEMIYPDDLEKYRNLLEMVSSTETSVMIEYRLKTKSGEIIYVSDTMTSRKYEDGSWKAFSAVTYVNDLKRPYEVVEAADNVVSCGFIKFTCETYPKVLFMNEGMKKLLGAEDGEELFLEDIRNNIYFMFPVEEKSRFRNCLKAADESKNNVSFKGSVFQINGEKKPVIGWIQKLYTEGNEEYEGFFLDLETCSTDERIVLRRDFIDALTSIYDTAYGDVTYTVKEIVPDGYTASYETNGSKVVITNTWNGESDSDVTLGQNGSNSDNDGTASKGVQTGDNTPIGLWIVLAVFSVAAMIAVVLVRQNHRSQP